MDSTEELEKSIHLLQDSIDFLNDAIKPLEKSTKDIDSLDKVLKTRNVFDILPESIVLQKSAKVKQIVEPMIEKDIQILDSVISTYNRRKSTLVKQSETLKLKLETANASYNNFSQNYSNTNIQIEQDKLKRLRKEKLKLLEKLNKLKTS